MAFAQVGKKYINLDTIEEVLVNHSDQGQVWGAEVRFTSGTLWVIDPHDEAKALVAALEAQIPQSIVRTIARTFNMTTEEVLTMISKRSPRSDAP